MYNLLILPVLNEGLFLGNIARSAVNGVTIFNCCDS